MYDLERISIIIKKIEKEFAARIKETARK